MFTRLPSDYLRIFYNADPGGGGGAPGGDGGAGGGAPAGGAPDGGGGGGEPKTFTQAEVDRMMGRTRSEARTAAANELAESLGVSVDEAKAIIEAKRQADDAAKDETTKALEAAQRAQTEAEAAKAAAAKERFEAKVERKLTAAGVPETALARAARMVTLAPDADDDAIAAEIDALKADVPGLFTPTSSDGTRPTPPGGTRPKPPAGGQGEKSAVERGRERWAAQHPAAS